MKNILLVTVATALVSLVPFFATFETENYPIHGFLIVGILVYLLFYTQLKRHNYFKDIKIWILYVLSYLVICVQSWIDLLKLFEHKSFEIGWYGIIPFITPVLALIMLKDVKPIPLKQINLFIFVVFFVHLLLWGNWYTALLEFP